MSVGMPAGSGRVSRLDPFALPVRFRAGDPGADARERIVEIGRERVVIERRVRGIPMKVSAELADFRGVAIRIVPPKDDFDGAIAVMLEHRDPGLTVPLFVAADGRDISVEWQTWAKALGLPALVEDADGNLRDPFRPVGPFHNGETAKRRRSRFGLRARRGVGRLRRKSGVVNAAAVAIHDSEREIIARD
jgi:hypothetical protein